jgi:RNA polymerase sigma-70 factor (TIGR02943 family)
MTTKQDRLPDDPAAWVDLYGDSLFRFALARVNDPAAAEDLVQETLLAALKNRSRYEGRAAVKTWLMAILKHKIVDHYRKNTRERPIESMDTDSDAFNARFNARGSWRQPPAKWAASPQKTVESKAFMDAFYQCLAGLPERLARVFRLREIDGIKGKQLCEEMQITPTNSWVMLHRARMRLRECLETNWFEAN